MKDVGDPKEVTKADLVPAAFGAKQNAFVNLAVGEYANREAIWCETLQQGDSRGPALQVICYPIAINQVFHSSTGGREERLLS